MQRFATKFKKTKNMTNYETESECNPVEIHVESTQVIIKVSLTRRQLKYTEHLAINEKRMTNS